MVEEATRVGTHPDPGAEAPGQRTARTPSCRWSKTATRVDRIDGLGPAAALGVPPRLSSLHRRLETGGW